MTKREKIKEVYYKYFDKEDVDITMHISVDGYIEKENLKLIKQVGFLENFEIQGFVCRPIELKGIENNNDWIKIESENDLPKENISCFFIQDKEILKGMYKQNVFSNSYGLYGWKTITHYQPIQKPKPPIY